MRSQENAPWAVGLILSQTARVEAVHAEEVHRRQVQRRRARRALGVLEDACGRAQLLHLAAHARRLLAQLPDRRLLPENRRPLTSACRLRAMLSIDAPAL